MTKIKSSFLVLIGVCLFLLGFLFCYSILIYTPSIYTYGHYNWYSGEIIIYTKHLEEVVPEEELLKQIDRTYEHELIHYKIDKGIIKINVTDCNNMRKIMGNWTKNNYDCNEIYAYYLSSS